MTNSTPDHIKTIQSRLKTAGISLTRTQIKEYLSTNKYDLNALEPNQISQIVETLKTQNKPSMLATVKPVKPVNELIAQPINSNINTVTKEQKSLVVRQAVALNIDLIDTEVESIVSHLNSVSSEANDFLLNLQQAILTFVANKKANFDSQVANTIHQVKQATEDFTEHQNRSLESAIADINKEIGSTETDFKSSLSTSKSKIFSRLR
jgi:hypothetical protein